MAKFRKKPVLIDAEPYVFGLEDGFLYGPRYIAKNQFLEGTESKQYPGYSQLHEMYVRDALENPDSQWKPYIQTLEGRMEIKTTDMIITGVRQERYPCKLDIFLLTYDEV